MSFNQSTTVFIAFAIGAVNDLNVNQTISIPHPVRKMVVRAVSTFDTPADRTDDMYQIGIVESDVSGSVLKLCATSLNGVVSLPCEHTFRNPINVNGRYNFRFTHYDGTTISPALATSNVIQLTFYENY